MLILEGLKRTAAAAVTQRNPLEYGKIYGKDNIHVSKTNELCIGCVQCMKAVYRNVLRT